MSPQVQQKDEIVPIPPHRVKYFGTTGRMLLPSPSTIAAVIERVPPHQLITTDLLRQHLTDQFDVEGTCPVTTQKSLKALANEPDQKAAYWRVIKKNGTLFSLFPGGVKAQAEHLREEGFTINTEGKAPKVIQFTERLARLSG